MENRLSNILTDEGPAVGNWISIGHPAIAEISAVPGFDFVVIDTEHTSIGIETLEDMIRAVEAGDSGVEPIVRIPWNDPVRIKRVLDLGAAGVMIPMIETVEAAEDAVNAMRYPPRGIRGVAPARASEYGQRFEEYFAAANEQIVTIVQIETEQGVNNVDEIAAVDGLDAIVVGHGDLSSSLGVFGEWDSDPFRDALITVLNAGKRSETPVGMLATDHKEIHRWADAGVDFMIVGGDMFYLIQGSNAAKEEFEQAVRDSTSN